jgi:hypothetical protein
MYPRCDLGEMLNRCRVQSDGFVALSGSAPWRLGAVLFARRSGAFAVVRKAVVDGSAYEFAGLYALPGGMARLRESAEDATVSAGSLLWASLLERGHREAGLTPEHLRDPVAAPVGPIVTSYTAKGQQRYTLVVPFLCAVGAGAHLHVSDRSVDESCWMTIPPDWERIAPANRVAVAHLVWKEMDADQRTLARPHVDQSVRQCSKWAASVGVAAAPPPWADGDELNSWRYAWPS